MNNDCLEKLLEILYIVFFSVVDIIVSYRNRMVGYALDSSGSVAKSCEQGN
jgi:hypothetical protein